LPWWTAAIAKDQNEFMSRIFIALLFSVVATSVLCQSRDRQCWKTATTQLDMNQCADTDAKAAEAELNEVYRRLLTKLKSDDNATKKLKVAQRAWTAFRDARLDELFPADDKQQQYGSIFPMCYAQVTAAISKERTAQLRRMLDEKDSCNISGGSGH
jgi:uncharacterized protein YecT (DUF1311 family)